MGDIMKTKLLLFLFCLMILLIIPVYADTAYLQYDRNENYETGVLSLDCENKVNTTAYFDF